MLARMPVVGNTKLIEYGIQTEDSDLRAHVCVTAKKVYVYRTEDGVRLIQSLSDKRKVAVKTGDYVTAKGYPVKPQEIENITFVPIPDNVWEHVKFSTFDNPTVKGQKAISVVRWMLRRGCFPMLPLHVKEVEDKDMQVKGQDIIISLSLDVKIQVKCDYEGGEGGKWGNLYLQTEECNPHKYN